MVLNTSTIDWCQVLLRDCDQRHRPFNYPLVRWELLWTMYPFFCIFLSEANIGSLFHYESQCTINNGSTLTSWSQWGRTWVLKTWGTYPLLDFWRPHMNSISVSLLPILVMIHWLIIIYNVHWAFQNY